MRLCDLELLFASNNELPTSLAKLATLADLAIQASGLAGPIPSGIASLTKLTDLRISDLNWNDSSLPSLSPLKNIKTLDLSCNKLTGPIPESFIHLANTDFVYYIAVSGQNEKLYRNARLSPLSLTYYGFCLINGNYTVNLHFAEIMFTDDRTYSSLRRRVFDVYIQGKLVLKDFDIELEAGGVNKPLTKNFTAVVTDTTLDIHFYWAGKGTSGIPVRGVYGPLVSAISVDPMIGVFSAVILVLGILWWKGCLKRKDSMHDDLKGLDLHTGTFTLRQIKAATNNFDPANKIGEGGFGPVFKTTQSSVGKVKAEDVPWTGSSASTADLYPVTVDTEYWEKRGGCAAALV
ncbi:probable leucine-rich repeat receptor-like serine/threonine-protein kinase At3g14840 [Salvia splendens]|uniref:probable leucine-rich repeat receptor-like serine/threonine-protein kinase At3g14840 n=1 Tax=Salvia splendens TaxID=180675 RepID=UPI001C2638D8|nr:probable leucine-rich repeat receptor-like serine/threonine-protein kinase At3g14840 [Salvia splendens]